MRTCHHIHLGRLAAAVVLIAAAAGLSAGPASADELPDPLSSSVARVSGDLSDGAPTPLRELDETVEDAVQPLVGGPVEEDGGSAQEEGITSGSSSSTASDGQTAPATAGEPERGRAAVPGSSGEQSGEASPGSLQVGTPVATVCVIPTSAASPAFEVDLQAAGVDLSSPVIEQFPQVFAACPEGAVSVDEETAAAVDAVVEGLLGACIRVTREAAPLQTTLIVLDRNVIDALTKAGLPLQELVVPCPGAGDGGSAGGRDAGDAGSAGDNAGAAPRSQAASATPGLASRLAFTGANPGPLLALATGLLGAGALLSRVRWLLVRR